MSNIQSNYTYYLNQHRASRLSVDQDTQAFGKELVQALAFYVSIGRSCFLQAGYSLQRIDNSRRVLTEQNQKMLLLILRMRAQFLAMQKALIKKDTKKVSQLIEQAACQTGFGFDGNFIIPAGI